MDDRLVKIGCAVVLYVAFSAILALLWRVLFAHKVEPAWMRRPRGISLEVAYALTGAVSFAYAISIDYFDPACSGPFPYGEPPECAGNPNLPEPLATAVLSLLGALGFIGGGAFGAWAGNDLFTLVMSLIQTAMIFPLGVVAGVLLGGVFLLGGALIYVGWILAWRRITGALR